MDDGPGGGSDGEDDMVGVVVGGAGLASAPGPGVGVARVSASVVLPKPCRENEKLALNKLCSVWAGISPF